MGSYCHSPQHAPSRCLTCRRRKKRCHRDAMCCPGNRCSSYICVPISESVLSHHISPFDEHNKLSNKDQSWRKNSKAHSKLKGHEGDPCLRSSDCSDGYCCARHFWTKICKPVLRLGEVCTKQRKKGSHGLEIFQRCDCAKGLSCKVWKDATSSSKSRLHMCQKVSSHLVLHVGKTGPADPDIGNTMVPLIRMCKTMRENDTAMWTPARAFGLHAYAESAQADGACGYYAGHPNNSCNYFMHKL
uniref:Dickkopf N-terminal cysteine-rich domain-containing protein n=1 Tax=Knipowitschia caucasica TaxID=637954 RepID=A0AAV2LLQ1_KNICA